jgi:hypothetical protein
MLAERTTGQKDTTAPLFASWERVFFGPPTKAAGGGVGDSAIVDLTPPSSSSSGGLVVTSPWLQPDPVALGDAQVFVDGLHENMLDIPLTDATLTKTARLLDEFSACTNVQHTAVRTTQYGLMRYARVLPVALTTAYSQNAQRGRRQVRWPFKSVEAAQLRRQRAVLLESVWSGMQLQARPPSLKLLAMDYLSDILRIGCPPLEITSGRSDLATPQETAVLSRLVVLWQSLGVQIKRAAGAGGAGRNGSNSNNANGGNGSSSGASRYELDPPIDQLTVFVRTGIGEQGGRLRLFGDASSAAAEEAAAAAAAAGSAWLRLGEVAKAYVCRQLELARPVDTPDGQGFTRHTRKKTPEEQQRQQEQDQAAGGGSAAYVPSDRWRACLGASPAPPGESSPPGGADKRKLESDGTLALAAPQRSAGAFLSGANAASSKRRRTTRSENKSAVVFKFLAGFSNAVRRPVLAGDLL